MQTSDGQGLGAVVFICERDDFLGFFPPLSKLVTLGGVYFSAHIFKIIIIRRLYRCPEAADSCNLITLCILLYIYKNEYPLLVFRSSRGITSVCHSQEQKVEGEEGKAD
jgi:hypothetical protein